MNLGGGWPVNEYGFGLVVVPYDGQKKGDSHKFRLSGFDIDQAELSRKIVLREILGFGTVTRINPDRGLAEITYCCEWFHYADAFREEDQWGSLV